MQNERKMNDNLIARQNESDETWRVVVLAGSTQQQCVTLVLREEARRNPQGVAMEKERPESLNQTAHQVLSRQLSLMEYSVYNWFGSPLDGSFRPSLMWLGDLDGPCTIFRSHSETGLNISVSIMEGYNLCVNPRTCKQHTWLLA